MPTNPGQNVSVYRYFLYDLLSNSFLAEIPFKNVSYGRAIKEAGPFRGSIPVTPETDTLDLYNTTIPGKTALYILRDNTCVWGGIIWTRTYNIITRNIEISGREFTSYFHHRNVWATWTHDYNVSVSVVDGIGTATMLDDKTYDFTEGLPILITFANDNLIKYGNYFTVRPNPTTTSFTFIANDDNGDPIPNIKDDGATANVHADTYHYVRELLEQIRLDFVTIEPTNTEVAPGSDYLTNITAISRASNIATATVASTQYIIPGQRIKIRNVGDGFDGFVTVKTVPSTTQFTYENSGTNRSNTTLTGNTATVIKKEVAADGIATLTTSSAHGFSPNDIMVVADIDQFLNGEYVIDSVTTNTITYTTYDTKVDKTLTTGTASVYPLAVVSTYGSFTANSDIGIVASTAALSNFKNKNDLYRGFQLKNFGEMLDSYSNILNGFEYRIDCAYDSVTNSFTRSLHLMPYKPTSLQTYLDSLPGGKLAPGEVAPPSAFGADKRVFEHPGNIIDATMEESAEDAATRFWVVGNDSALSSDASQPYAAASALDYLSGITYPWPILDQIEQQSNIYEEATLQAYAEQYLSESLPPISTFNISVNGSLTPETGSYSPGDWCSIIFDDPFIKLRLDSSAEVRDDVLIRKIDSYEVTVPDTPTFPESVTLQLITEAQVDKVGTTQAVA
jgi:hypothetical protein